MCEFSLRSLVARTLTLVALLVCTAPLALAQVTSGSLQGVVLDPNSAAVAGATVKITNVETGISRETTTNAEGFYRVTNLIPGSQYRIDVTASGFATKALENVTVRAASENTADIQVGVAGIQGETVQVTGETALIDSAQSQLSTSYTPQQLTQLPFVGAIDNLALLTPGVVTPGDTDFANGVGISANGNRGRSNNFQIDGQDNNDNSVAGPSLSITNAEAIGDYQVITNSFSAEFGRNSGAQINVVTRSGTNEFHGAVFAFHRNAAFNARDNIEKLTAGRLGFLADNGLSQFQGFADRYASGPEPFRDNRFGGRLGGPIVKNKAFFFATYEGTFFRGETLGEGLAGGSFAPSLEGTGISSRIFGNAATGALTAVGPATAGNAGSFLCAPPVVDTDGDSVPDEFAFEGVGGANNPNNLAPLAIVADPTAPGGRSIIYGCEPVRSIRSNSTVHQFIGRADWNLTDKDVIVGRYIFDDSEFPLQAGRFLGGNFFDVPSRNNNLGVTYTRTVSSRTVNEARFNFSRLDVAFGDTSVNPGPGVTFAGTRSLAGGLLTAFGALNNIPQSRVVDVYQFQDTLTQTIGNHGLKYGADIRHQKVDNFFLPNLFGQYRFSSGGTLPANTFFNFGGANGLTGSARTSATAFENFLLGRPDQINFAFGNPQIQTSQNDFFFFVQDDWRIRPTLTLNLGLRYEVSTTPFNPIIDQVAEREANPATALFNTAFPLEFRTTNRLPIDKNNFGPRVGFAWSPNFNFLGDRFREGRTVVRGGFGLAYDPPYFNIVLNTVTAAPFAGVGQIRQTPGAAGSVSFPFLPNSAAALNNTPGTNAGDPRLFNQTRVDPDLYNPYTMSFNFGVQQELFRRSVLEVRYVGSRIVGQFQTINGNPDVRFLAQAGDYIAGNPGLFTGGRLPGTCSGATCLAPTAGNSFNTRTADPNFATVRITGSGRIDPNFGPIRTRINGASSTYNGMQVRFDTRFTNDLVLNANYTWSRTIDNASEIFSTLGGGQTVAHSQNPFDYNNGERGLSAFHQKHNFTANFLYELPFMKDQRGALGKVLGGFQIGGLVRVGSGRPYTPNTFFGTYDPGFENALIGAGGLRPYNGNPNAPVGTIAFGYSAACNILFGGPECDYNGGEADPGDFIVFNTRNVGSVGTVVSGAEALQQARLIYNDFGLFTQFGAAAGAGLADLEAFNLFRTPYGDVGRNTFFGENFATANLSLFKTTNITENTKIEFRAEAFNIFNHRNFGVPDPITEDASFVNFVGTFQNPGYNNGGARSLRFGLRFLF